MTPDRTMLACFLALPTACLVASMLAFGLVWGGFATPIVMIWVAFTALPLYGVASLCQRPNWATAMLIGAACTAPLFLVVRTDSQVLYGLRTLTLPGMIGGLVFHGIFTTATHPRES